MRKSKAKNHDPRLSLCYSEVLIFVQNNESVAARKPSSVLCASLNSKNSRYMAVCSSFILCYKFFVLFDSWQWVTEFQRVSVIYNSVLYAILIQLVQSSSHQSWIVRLYSSTHEFTVSPEQLRIRSFGLLFIKKKSKMCLAKLQMKNKKKDCYNYYSYSQIKSDFSSFFFQLLACVQQSWQKALNPMQANYLMFLNCFEHELSANYY